MRTLGLDLGTKTLGVAVSDELGWTAQGLETIAIDEEHGNYGLERLRAIIEEYGVDAIVVGWPKNMNGTLGPRAEASERFAARLREEFSLPVVLWDERLSTMAAERMLIAADVSRKKRRKVIDKMAAAVILQSYLDSKR
ncbi:crossover junction endodeoxyribonuclease RuvA [Geobacillus subterraneus]|uniref:Putative pre-16S rRNA nuclease n=2 Tax=Geobacillus TaxID=129337 RepID=A0ABN4NEZ5_9BACL|nr:MULTISPECIES: Holliday junction resolvase RuvX [Geobacillus]AMX82801.1 crossover junction endodeoxyribonuclease RuvA [Geobacillus subterraneus]KZS26118.1 crossover junction endodeoxyribonuclease RuvA [Geobacillus subterraneus]OXB90894.1 Holliday junction resolvase RuvX [Geobacillus uzenensis]QIZ68468.1 Holliday junction resolvase RuvX [Geobacillus subterraneus]WPZ17491.1 Holliday junction resolvase RuvX [Geobacillus subterraneus]